MKHEHNMNCQDILKNMSEYIDGELDGQLCAEIEAHIETCPDCKIVIDTLKKTIQLVQISGKETELPKDVRKRLFARLHLDDDVRKD